MKAGFLSKQAPGTMTPGRNTIVKFGVEEDGLVEPPYCLERSEQEIGMGTKHSAELMHFVPGNGWELKPICFVNSAPSTTLPSIKGNPFLPSSKGKFHLEVADGFEEVPFVELEENQTQTAYTETRFLQKKVRAGESWTCSLLEDQNYLPEPLEGTSNPGMDRIGMTQRHSSARDTLLFKFYVPGTTFSLRKRLLNLYFSGPAGADEWFDGYGQYCLVFFNSGKVILYEHGEKKEYSEKIWKLRSEFRFSEPERVSGHAHTILIKSYSTDSSFNDTEENITFFTSTPNAESEKFCEQKKYFHPNTSNNVHLYSITQKSKKQAGDYPYRIDIQRDIRILFQLSKVHYIEKSELKNDPFMLPFSPSKTSNFRLEWISHLPKNCKIIGKIFALTPNGEQELKTLSKGHSFREFQILPSHQVYFVKFFFKGNHTSTPTLYRYRVVRNGCIEKITLRKFETTSISKVEIKGSCDEDLHEYGQIILEDPNGRLTPIQNQSLMPVSIETSLGNKKEKGYSALFRGYLTKAKSIPSISLGNSLFSESKSPTRIICSLIGPWHRLNEAKIPIRYDFGIDPEAYHLSGTRIPYKVTEAIKILLTWAGYAEENLDIDDLPVRFWPSIHRRHSLVLEPMSNIGAAITRFSVNYLGSVLVFEPNAGLSGVWKLRPLKKLNGKPIAAFLSQAPKKGLAHHLASYAENHSVGFILKGSLSHWTVPPKANHISVTGIGPAKTNGLPTRITRVLSNTSSYHSDENTTTDPQNIDYLGRFVPLSFVDISLNCPDAVYATARRYYDLYCHGNKMIKFRAPLILVIDPKEYLLQTPRSLKCGDLVLVDNTHARIKTVTIQYEKDSMQLATYECELLN